MRYIKSKYILYCEIFIALAMAFLFLNQCGVAQHEPLLRQTNSVEHEHSAVKETVTRPLDESIQKDSKDIFQNEDALFSYVKKFGLKQTITHLDELVPLYGDCHQPAHKAGRFAYEIYGNEAFRAWGIECHSGALHGTIEAYFKDHGTAKISDDVKLICRPELNPFFRHQCLHGIGHGLMAWSHYELFDALKGCDPLGEGQHSCWTGVFMENNGGGLAGHGAHGAKEGRYTKYLNDDPQYPCTVVDDKYKSDCYFLQTDRMMQLFSGDFSKIASACSQAPTLYQPVCFQSMGRDVGGIHRGNAAGVIQACSFAAIGSSRTDCLSGAVQDAFWDPNGQDNALNLCKLLKDKTEKDACYNTIFSRAQDILTSKEDFKLFCSKAESTYQSMCFGFIRQE